MQENFGPGKSIFTFYHSSPYPLEGLTVAIWRVKWKK
jgi:hypothetical protein